MRTLYIQGSLALASSGGNREDSPGPSDHPRSDPQPFAPFRAAEAASASPRRVAPIFGRPAKSFSSQVEFDFGKNMYPTTAIRHQQTDGIFLLTWWKRDHLSGCEARGPVIEKDSIGIVGQGFN